VAETKPSRAFAGESVAAFGGSWLGGGAYVPRLLELVPALLAKAPRAGASQAAQAEFLRKKLRAEYLYPLLWNSRT
jgi:hypothetical protein